MIIIALGMHRSGTSALANLLHNSNIVMGEDNNFIPKSSQENIKGFYENYLFRMLNDNIAEKCGYRIKSWQTNIPKMNSNIFQKYRMRRILRDYNKKYPKWGWKDPRTCLTLGLWLNEITAIDFSNECKILYIMRDPYAVALSMTKRRNTNFEKGLELWRLYNQRALETIDSFRFDVQYLTYESLCSMPTETSSRISSFLEHPIDNSIAMEVIDSELNRSGSIEDRNKVSKPLPESVEKLKAKIVRRTE
jgi:hypothetical protein